MHTREDDELAEELLAMDRKHETFFKQVLETGIVTGLFAGSGMALLWMMLSAVAGRGFLLPMQLVAAAWWPDALSGPVGLGVVIGVLIHLLVSALFGIAFASLVRKARGSRAIALGVVFSIAVFFFMRYLVCPWADPVLTARVSPWLLFVANLAYGVLIGLAVPARRALLSRGARASPREELPA
jgi:hypothetical protein